MEIEFDIITTALKGQWMPTLSLALYAASKALKGRYLAEQDRRQRVIDRAVDDELDTIKSDTFVAMAKWVRREHSKGETHIHYQVADGTFKKELNSYLPACQKELKNVT